MGYSGGILTAPFTKIAANGQGDLQLALGRSVLSHSQLVGDVDANGNPVNRINMWAKYKPFRDATVAFASSAARELAREVANYGISIPSAGFGSIIGNNGMIANLASAAWSYVKPRVGTDPLRALDFDGYRPGATSPISALNNGTTQSSASTMDVGVGFSRNIASQAGFLTLADLHVDGHSISDSFANYYFGVCLYYSDSLYFATTMNETYGSIGASLSEIGLTVKDVAVPGSGSRTYRVIPFFATTPFNKWPSGTYSGTLFPIPFAEGSVVVSKASDFYVSVFMYTLMTDSDDILYYTYSFVNPTSSSHSGTINIWALRTYNINNTYGSVILSESRTVGAGGNYTSPTYSITDGITVRDILANCPYVGVELRIGEARIKYSISAIAIDIDPQDLT